MKRHVTRAGWVFAVVAVISGISMAQAPATGTPAWGSFGGGPFDVINLGNLNVHFAIPIVHKAGRGMPFLYDITYDSSVWYPGAVNGVLTWQPSQNGYWGFQGLSGQINIGNLTYSVSGPTGGTCGQFNQFTWQQWKFTNVVYTDNNGTHPIPFAGAWVQSNADPQCPPAGPQPLLRPHSP